MIYVILPAYNEEKDINKTLDDFRNIKGRAEFKIILVDDGSKDGTVQEAEKYRREYDVIVVRHETNKGLGKALASGFRYLENALADSDAVVTMDADGTHPAALIIDMAAKIKNGADAVIASRFCSAGEQHGVPPARRLLSGVSNIILKVLFPDKAINDYTSGYRAFSGRVVREVAGIYGPEIVSESGFAATPELLLKVRKSAVRIEEVPLALNYGRKSGASKIDIPKTVLRYVMLMMKLKGLR
ncbi:MAG: glycosyltransferase family 2 protein [Endomicrobiales bacterium]|nr:glycosyltransferase family 2 protein [Endomicrobiales bacterium]